MISLFGSVLKKKMNTHALQHSEEQVGTAAERPVRDASIFRTAPMTISQEEKQVLVSKRPPYQEQKKEDRPQGRDSIQNAATVQLQKVGPDTMVWKNNGIE